MNKSKFGPIEYSAIVLCVVIGIAVVAVMVFMGGNKPSGDVSHEDDYQLIDLLSSESDKAVEESSLSDDTKEDDVSYIVIQVDSDSMYKGDLILVNKENFYEFKDETAIINVFDGKNKKYKIGTGGEKLFEKTILAANEFLGDFYDLSGLKNVTMINGYITEADQQKKYESYIKTATPEEAQKWGVKAGASDHHTALSFNLMLYPSGGKIGEGEYSWLTENAYRYGFVIRYPDEKSDITCVKDENHFRYVGVPHAEYMYKNNLCLEEYILELEKTTFYNPLKFTSGNKEYIVYFSPVDNSSSQTEIKIPEGYSYTVSGDNVSGFIITAVLP